MDVDPTAESQSPPARKLDLSLLGGVTLLIIAVACGGLGFRAYLALNDREPLLAGLPAGGAHERELPPPRQVRRAVLVIADGLTAEMADTLAPLTQLAARGIHAEADAPSPTFSRPSYVTWLAGLDPVDSGVRTNRYRGAFPLDSLPSRARAGGLRSLGYDEDSRETKLADLFGPHLSTRLSGLDAWPQVLEALPQTDLALIALTATDKAGHQRGAASSEYQEAARSTSKRITELAAALELDRDVIFVVNDHGHLPGGGHGGIEPAVRRLFLFGAGAGLGRNLKPQHIDQKDLAPTLAHLLGLLPPAHNRGWSLGWALDPTLDPFFYEAAFATQYTARHRVERYLAAELRASLPPGHGYPRVQDLVRATVGNLGEARRLGWHMLQLLQHRVDDGRLARLGELRIRRGVWTGVPLLVVLGLMLIGRRLGVLRFGAGSFLLGVLAMAVIAAALYLLDVRPSLSQAGPRGLLLARLLGATAAGAVLHILLAFVLRDHARAALIGRLLAGAWLFSAVALASFALVPVAPGSALPDGRLLAAAELAGACWLSYLVLVGLTLTFAGLRRPR